VLPEPGDQRARGLELRADQLVAGGLVQPGLERVAAVDGELLQAEAIDPGVVERVAARRAFEGGLGGGEAGCAGRLDGALESRRAAAVVDRPPKALQLV
jgi:hypothetical protein